MTTEQQQAAAPHRILAEYAAAQVIDAERIAKRAAEGLKAAKERFIVAADTAGIDSVEVDGHRVAKADKERRNFDVDVLARLVPHATFTQVTKTSVDTKKFDAARTLGSITADTEELVTTKRTPYTEVRVTILKD
jgi:hypothetical protein